MSNEVNTRQDEESFEKFFQLIRYYSDERRRARSALHVGARRWQPAFTPTARVESSKIWEADPLLCPTCGCLMRIVSFITEGDVIEKILEKRIADGSELVTS